MKILTKKKEQKIIKEECWNLNTELLKWLNIHFKVYKKDASKMVNLTYHTFTYEGKEYTQLEIIDRIIELTGYLLLDDNYLPIKVGTIKNKQKQLFDLIELVFNVMWW